MWQRIQTVWLVLAFAAMIALLFLPIGVFATPQGNWIMYNWSTRPLIGVGTVMNHWGLFVLALIIALLSLYIVFLYKKRKLQMRLTMLGMILTVGYLVYYTVEAAKLTNTLQASYGFKFALALPIITIILLFMARRAIRKDEVLVRMSNRLR